MLMKFKYVLQLRKQRVPWEETIQQGSAANQIAAQWEILNEQFKNSVSICAIEG